MQGMCRTWHKLDHCFLHLICYSSLFSGPLGMAFCEKKKNNLLWFPESDQPVTVGHMTIHLHREQNTLNLVADVHKMEMLPKVFDHGLDAGAEFIKPGFDISVEDLQSGVPFAAVNIKRHQCKVCGKLLRSGRALGGHMRLHYVRKYNLADCPNSAMMEEQMQKHWTHPSFYLRIPGSHGIEI